MLERAHSLAKKTALHQLGQACHSDSVMSLPSTVWGAAVAVEKKRAMKSAATALLAFGECIVLQITLRVIFIVIPLRQDLTLAVHSRMVYLRQSRSTLKR
jgi:hypothetical protein